MSVLVAKVAEITTPTLRKLYVLEAKVADLFPGSKSSRVYDPHPGQAVCGVSVQISFVKNVVNIKSVEECLAYFFFDKTLTISISVPFARVIMSMISRKLFNVTVHKSCR